MAIKTKIITTEIEVTDSLTCDNCGTDISLEFANPNGLTEQGSNALQIRFGGGYGMYIDPIGEPAERFRMLWCKTCADKLADTFPSIAERIRPEMTEMGNDAGARP